MLIRTLFGASLFCLVAGTTAALAAPDYSYDASVPLNATYGKPRTLAPGVIARDVTFTSTTGNKVVGEVISGAARKPMPAALFLHWLGEPKTTNHTEFEGDAIALAKRGGTSVLIDLLWSKGESWFNTVGADAAADIKQAEAQVIDMRRAYDLLEQQPHVDRARIALVGHDFGAMFGTLMLSADARPRVFVCMAAVPTFSEWYLLGKKEPAGYGAALGALDITGSLKSAKTKAMLFQFATGDHYIKADRAGLLFDSAPLPKGEFLYDTDHALAVPAADADRRAWLMEQLF